MFYILNNQKYTLRRVIATSISTKLFNPFKNIGTIDLENYSSFYDSFDMTNPSIPLSLFDLAILE